MMFNFKINNFIINKQFGNFIIWILLTLMSVYLINQVYFYIMYDQKQIIKDFNNGQEFSCVEFNNTSIVSNKNFDVMYNDVFMSKNTHESFKINNCKYN